MADPPGATATVFVSLHHSGPWPSVPLNTDWQGTRASELTPVTVRLIDQWIVVPSPITVRAIQRLPQGEWALFRRATDLVPFMRGSTSRALSAGEEFFLPPLHGLAVPTVP
jgi:hypothetical protein